MSLNGGGAASVVFVDTSLAANPWTNATASQVLLNAGNITIAFTNWCALSPASEPLLSSIGDGPAPHAVISSLFIPSVLPVTQSLFSKLLSRYGTEDIFSGRRSKRHPAILGLDMIEYSPTRSPWWKGFYTYGSTFNLTTVLADPACTDHAPMISDMDAIATQLLRLQAANGLLHEADGGWFWCESNTESRFFPGGAYELESCKTLYHLMYDRSTNHHKLCNLIWAWNSVGPSWYPGGDVVDILGYDSYPAIGDHGPVSSQSQQLIALGTDKKLVTLPEVGSIPDPDVLKVYHGDWSYFVTWNGDYIQSDSYNPLAFKQRVYNDPTVLKLTDLGDWKGTATKTSTLGTSVSRPARELLVNWANKLSPKTFEASASSSETPGTGSKQSSSSTTSRSSSKSISSSKST
ncbi:unnamed protein product [Diplocarpon coronariae]